MAQDLLTTYKYGWKTSYYQNTYDSKKDIDEPSHPIGFVDNVPEEDKPKEDDEACEYLYYIMKGYYELCSKHTIH